MPSCSAGWASTGTTALTPPWFLHACCDAHAAHCTAPDPPAPCDPVRPLAARKQLRETRSPESEGLLPVAQTQDQRWNATEAAQAWEPVNGCVSLYESAVGAEALQTPTSFDGSSPRVPVQKSLEQRAVAPNPYVSAGEEAGTASGRPGHYCPGVPHATWCGRST